MVDGNAIYNDEQVQCMRYRSLVVEYLFIIILYTKLAKHAYTANQGVFS